MATGLICGLLFGLGIGVPIGAVIFRAAISIANRIIGPEAGELPPTEGFTDGGSFAPRDESNPYSAPSDTSVAGIRRRTAIEEPDFGRACVIVFITILISFALNFLTGIVFGAAGGPQVILGIINLVVGYLVAAKVYESMLPTTFGRASLIYGLQILITIAVGAIIFGVVFAVGAIAG